MEMAVSGTPEVSIIVPARNEEVCLWDCLRSLVVQDGVGFEIIVVDDSSTDRTREIAESFPGVRVISPEPLPPGWTGKNNALVAGVKAARGRWLLFTDADTVHLPRSLARALAEAKEHRADLLSYSPEQIAVTFWEMAILPVVFAELAREYSPKKVSDPQSTLAAANGQYILVRRDAYETIGGHEAVAADLLEDVALARMMKQSDKKIRFRYAADAVRTRMYRNFRQLREGWTKNLALLFPNPGTRAAKLLLMWMACWLICAVGVIMSTTAAHWWDGAMVLGPFYLAIRLQKSNFSWDKQIEGALFGMPMFSYLLLRSARAHRRGDVQWKGRRYEGGAGVSNDDAITMSSAAAPDRVLASRH